ncbi:MAG: hypothetical protein R3B90_15955 [Planctomycetaceae bacterium]
MASYHRSAGLEPLDRLARRAARAAAGRLARSSGALFAGGRQVVAAWIPRRALSPDFQNCYYFLQSLGRRWRDIGGRLLVLVLLKVLKDHERVLLAIDDSPTKRYGPKVQGGHPTPRPTPGPTGKRSARTRVGDAGGGGAASARGTIRPADLLLGCTSARGRAQAPEALPLDVPDQARTSGRPGPPRLPQPCRPTAKRCGAWPTALRQAAVRRPLLKAGVTLVGRLRKDAALHDRRVKTKRRRPPTDVRSESPLPGQARRPSSRLGADDRLGVRAGRWMKTKTFLRRTPFGGTIRW